MEKWNLIRDFPDYEVSDEGQVRNANSGRILRVHPNQKDILMAGLRLAGRQHMRSVAVLVAEAFLPRPRDPELNNAVIHRDGNRHNVRAKNLMWRPRGYAIRYHQQFDYYRFHRMLTPVGTQLPVIDIDTEEVFYNSTDCAIANGLLEVQLMLAITNERPIGITGQEFRLYE